MALINKTFNEVLNHTRGTGATRVSPTTGFIVGVDFSGSSNTFAAASVASPITRVFGLTADVGVSREWSVGENVIVTSQAGTIGSMTGTVSAYNPAQTVSITSGSASGTTVTLNFAALTAAIPVGTLITVNAVGGTNYNGTFAIVSSTTTSLTYTAAIAPTGTVTGGTFSYQSLTLSITSTTVTTGTSTDWRVGSLEVRRGANGLVVESTPTQSFGGNYLNFGNPINGVLSSSPIISPDGSLNAIRFTANSNINILNNSATIGTNKGLAFVLTQSGAHNIQFYIRPFGENFDSFGVLVGNSVNISSPDNPGGTPAGYVAFNYKTGALYKQVHAVVAASLTNAGNGWFKFNMTFINTSGSTSTGIFPLNTTTTISNGVSGFDLYGFQVTNGGSNVALLPTTTVSWTRNADTVTFNSTALQSVRQGQGTIYVEADFPVTTTRTTALSLTGTNSEISLSRQTTSTTASFTKMVESGNTQVFGSSTGGNLFKNLGKQYEPALGTRNDTGATNTNLALVFASIAVASSGNGFGIAAGQIELTTDSNLSSVTVRGVGSDTLNGAHWTGSRFIVANGSAVGRTVVSLDGQSFRVINSPVITQPCNEVTSGLVGGITRVVMVGNGGAIYTSDDQGETWSARTSGTTQNLNGVSFGTVGGTNYFIAAGANGELRYSTDAITWTNGAGQGAGTFFDVKIDNNVAVAVGAAGTVFTSTNGTSWTAATATNTTQQLNGVTYSQAANIWVAVGAGGTVITATSPAGTWTKYDNTTTPSTGQTTSLTEVVFHQPNGLFYITNGGSGAGVYSIKFNPSLVSFTPILPADYQGNDSNGLSGCASSGSGVLFVGVSGNIRYSTDGTTFTSRTNNGAALNGIAFGNNRFVSVGNAANGSGYIATIDADGTVTRRVSGVTGNVVAVERGIDKFVAFAGGGAGTVPVLDSVDGQTWNSRNINVATNSTGMGIGNGRFVFFGDAAGAAQIFSLDANLTNQITSSISGFVPRAAFGAMGVFVILGLSGRLYTSTDTANWTLRDSGTTQNLTSVMYSTRDNCWYAAGANGTLLRSDDNAVTWYSVNEAMQGYVLNNSTLQANATSRGNRDGRNRFALSFNTNSVKVAANGNMVVSDTSASIGSITAVTLGEGYNGTIRNIRFFPQAKTDSEVVQISLGSITPGINDTLQINAAGDTLQINAAGDTLRIN